MESSSTPTYFEAGLTIRSHASPARKPIEPLRKLLPALRKAEVPVIWLNWGNRPDRLNLSPSLLHVYKPSGEGVGLERHMLGVEHLRQSRVNLRGRDAFEVEPLEAREDRRRGLADLLRLRGAEDEDDAREIIARSLEDFGAEVTSVASGVDALALLRAPTALRLPHVILTDIGMPDLDGYRFLRELRKLPTEHGGRVPAIAVTAHVTPDDRTAVLDAGFVLHVEKPVAPLALAAAIARVTAGVTPAS